MASVLLLFPLLSMLPGRAAGTGVDASMGAAVEHAGGAGCTPEASGGAWLWGDVTGSVGDGESSPGELSLMEGPTAPSPVADVERHPSGCIKSACCQTE
mmetsp:Transcript_23492/g.58327  ORF Transcript_23492/g.58327 Transcript_23492/m.58327 type:complete len:99 (-) Transcript_23492:6-302(-)